MHVDVYDDVPEKEKYHPYDLISDRLIYSIPMTDPENRALFRRLVHIENKVSEDKYSDDLIHEYNRIIISLTPDTKTD